MIQFHVLQLIFLLDDVVVEVAVVDVLADVVVEPDTK